MPKKTSQLHNGGLIQKGNSVATAEERHHMIAEAAYYRALKRGFEGGNADDDWRQAERDIDSMLLETQTRAHQQPSPNKPGRAQSPAARTRH